MADRTFKLHGVGYDSAGSVNVILSIGGVEKFNGAVSVGTTNIFGSDMTPTELLSFTLDDSVTGDTTWVISMTGTDHTSKLWLKGLSANLTKNNMVIDYDWFSTKLLAHGGDVATTPLAAEDQTHIANTIGQSALDAAQAGLYNKLVAGTAVPGDHGYYISQANEAAGGKQTAHYEACNWTLSNGVRDSEAYDVTSTGMWPRIGSGSTLNMTVGLGIQNYVYQVPVVHPDDL